MLRGNTATLVAQVFKMAKILDRCSCETLLAPCVKAAEKDDFR